MDFDKLTIWDSLLLAVAEARYEQPHRVFSERTVFERHESEIRQHLDYFGFTDPTAFAMSAGEKKLLDIVRCLLLRPSFLLLDEPTAGLPGDLTDKVMTVVRDLAAAGTSVVIVEHDLNVIWSLCDDGPLHGRGQRHPARRPAVDPRAPDRRREVPRRGSCLRRPGSATLEVEGLRSGYHGVTVLKGLDFTVGNEIFAVLGANGAGKTTLLATLARLIPLMAGTIRFQGEDVSHACRRTRPPPGGSATCPRRRAPSPTSPCSRTSSVGGMIGRRSRDERMAEVFELFPDLRALRGQPAGTLSGGESRMVACGRALMQDPKVLLLDEPTAGLSPLYVDLFFDKIKEIHQTRGVAIVLAEQNATKALQVADRVMVLSLGEAYAVMDAAELTTQQLKEGYRI